MKNLALVAVLAVTACQPDIKNLDRKIDALAQKIDQQCGAGGGRPAAQQRPPRAEPDRAKTYAVPIDGDHFVGPADAKVTLVKAYDYACPYCEKVRDTMRALHEKYGKDLRVVSKQFVVHPQTATSGALAFCAAAKQGKAAEMDNLIWDKSFNARNFDKDIPGEQPGQPATKCWDHPNGCALMVGFAQELKLDVDKFKADMKGCQPLIQKDMRDLQQLGVAATPSFFVNGRFISGAMPIDNFSQLIDEELKKANDRIAQGTPQAQYYQQWVLDKGLKTLEAPKQ